LWARCFKGVSFVRCLRKENGSEEDERLKSLRKEKSLRSLRKEQRDAGIFCLKSHVYGGAEKLRMKRHMYSSWETLRASPTDHSN
jgi:hypothetical protein